MFFLQNLILQLFRSRRVPAAGWARTADSRSSARTWEVRGGSECGPGAAGCARCTSVRAARAEPCWAVEYPHCPPLKIATNVAAPEFLSPERRGAEGSLTAPTPTRLAYKPLRNEPAPRKAFSLHRWQPKPCPQLISAKNPSEEEAAAAGEVCRARRRTSARGGGAGGRGERGGRAGRAASGAGARGGASRGREAWRCVGAAAAGEGSGAVTA